jgi:hypothetical protein
MKREKFNMKKYTDTKIIVEIRRNDTGEIRALEMDDQIEDGMKFPSDFIWEDGNFSCDCNRSLFFRNAGGAYEHARCTDGRYSVNLSLKDTGEVYYREF